MVMKADEGPEIYNVHFGENSQEKFAIAYSTSGNTHVVTSTESTGQPKGDVFEAIIEEAKRLRSRNRELVDKISNLEATIKRPEEDIEWWSS